MTPILTPSLHTLVGEPWPDYGLVDSGDGRKLERYGRYRFIRPEPQALWSPAADWQATHLAPDAEFVPGADEDGGGRWRFDKPTPRDGWPLAWDNVRFTAQTTPFRHLGFFPDMAPVWTWLREQLAMGEAAGSSTPTGKSRGLVSSAGTGPRLSPGKEATERRQPEFLNLFGYTGVGSLALASAGARVTHVDASKKSVEAARANARLSGLDQAPIRWLVDDAAKFVAREGRRGRRYDAILLDPPKFGRGPDGEVWRLEEHLPGLIAGCRQLLDADSRCLFLTVYAVRMSALAIGEMLRQALGDLPGQVECGELGVREEARGLILPTAIWARWSQ